jgi:hypothetical protein
MTDGMEAPVDRDGLRKARLGGGLFDQALAAAQGVTAMSDLRERIEALEIPDKAALFDPSDRFATGWVAAINAVLDLLPKPVLSAPEPEERPPCPKCGHPHGPLPKPWQRSDGGWTDPFCDWPMGPESCDCRWRGEDSR